MKTIIYKKSENNKGDYWFNGIPFIEWITLDGVLYNSSVSKYMLQGKDNVVKSISVTDIKDELSDSGITRRIALYISK